MILTVTLNASIDKLYLMDSITPETVMRVREVHNTPGGKGLNVSRVARKLGEPVMALGFTGGFNGSYLESMLNASGVIPCFTHVDAETRSCINCWDMSAHRSTEYLEPGASVTSGDVDQFMDDFIDHLPQADAVTISGSIPAGVPKDIYSQLISICTGEHKPVLLDTSGAMLAQSVFAGPTLIKPNEDEIQALIPETVLNAFPPKDQLLKLNDLGIPYAVLSMGAQGALLAHETHVIHGQPPHIDPQNTVGCGDSMLAGFAVGFARGWSIEKSFRTALAVSAASALSLLTGDYQEEDYERILPQVTIEEVP